MSTFKIMGAISAIGAGLIAGYLIKEHLEAQPPSPPKPEPCPPLDQITDKTECVRCGGHWTDGMCLGTSPAGNGTAGAEYKEKDYDFSMSGVLAAPFK